MSRLDEMRSATGQRLGQARARHEAQTRGEVASLLGILPEHLPPEPDLKAIADPAQRARVYDAWLARRAALFRGEPAESEAPPAAAAGTPEAAAPGLPAVPAAGQAEPPAAETPVPAVEAGEAWFARMDAAVMTDFWLGRFALPEGLAAKPQLCRTLGEFLRRVGEGLGLNAREQAELETAPPERLMQAGMVHLPGQGCVVRPGALPEADRGLQRASQSRQPHVLLGALKVYLQTRWCDGIFYELTGLGRQMAASGEGQISLGRRLGLDLSRWRGQAGRVEALERAGGIVQAGWREWLWDYLARKSRSPIGDRLVEGPPNLLKTYETFGKIASLFPLVIDLSGLNKILDAAGVVKYLFLDETGLSPKLTNRVLQEVEKFTARNGQGMQQAAGFHPQSALGWLYFSRLEANLGTFCVPYAYLVACHTQAPPPEVPWEQVEALAAADPLATPDSRLAMLADLNPGGKYNPHGMALAAWEKFKMDGPREYLV